MKLKKLTIIAALSVLAGTTGCTDFVEPGKDNVLTREDVIANPVLAEGILLKASSSATRV